MRLNKHCIIALSVTVAVFLFSLFFYIFQPRQLVERPFFFYSVQEASLRGESRLLPKLDSVEADLNLFLNEMQLGPMDIMNHRILPEGKSIRSHILRGSQLLIDFDIDLLRSLDRMPLRFEDICAAIEKSIMANFSSIKSVNFFVQGTEAEREE